jgi:uncharacterized coiled-coil protein SlyX
MNPLIELKKPTPLIVTVLSLACFALAQAVVPPPDGGYPGGNTAEGNFALRNLTTGQFNTAVGLFSLAANTDGDANTGVGASALHNNTEGVYNTAVGVDALNRNRVGGFNTAVGTQALFANTIGDSNTAVGAEALRYNTTGTHNTAVGVDALPNNNAESNTGVGNGALFNNTTGSLNTAIGWQALDENTTGFGNIAVGSHAGQGIVTGNFNIDIGNSGFLSGESGTIRIGQNLIHSATYIAGISGQTASGGAAVFVNTDGKLGTLTSSARFKTDIKSMDNTSEAILALKPVTFRYKKEIDTQCTPQFGLVAEDVEKVNPDLVIRDREGKPYTVRYDAVNAMLLNEFLKEYRKNERQETTIVELKSTVAQQQKQIEALTAGLQKVSAQIEVSKSAPQTVKNTD